MQRMAFLFCALLGCSRAGLSANTTPRDTTEAGAAKQDPASAYLLSAFFGLDNKLPRMSGARLCRGAGGDDGMPVIFSKELDPTTLDAGDFQVLTRAGERGAVRCVTLEPAGDPGELRTALLVGEFGNEPSDPPVSVEMIGSVLSADKTLDFKGATITVTPLPPGPSLITAEVVPEAQWRLGSDESSWGHGDSCPKETKQIVRVTWAGGITRLGGDEVGDNERKQYQVALRRADGSTAMIVPFALADLGDGDNYHQLCLDSSETPLSISFPAGYVADPNGDINPDTKITVAP